MQKRILAGFVLAAVLLVLFSLLAYRVTRGFIAASDEVAHTHEVIGALESVAASLEEAEGCQHGFVITGEETYLDQYAHAAQVARNKIDALEHILADDVEEQARLPLLRARAARKLDIMDRVVESRKQEGLESARNLIATGNDRRAMEDVRDLIAQMEEDENLALDKGAAESSYEAQQSLRFFWSLTGVILGLLLLVYSIVRRDMETRRRTGEALARARDAAMESTRLKSEFLAAMSHEIRTPMNGITGMADLLLHTRLDAEQLDYADTIHSSADSLLTLLNDILDFSKIEAGKLDFEILDFDLLTLAEETVELLAPRAATKHLELVCDVDGAAPRRLRGDPGRVRQVMTNLLANAIKFTEAGEVVLRISPVTEEGGHCRLRFAVQDTGIGISQETAQQLFQPFTQADGSTTRKYGGTGLGLAIAKRLAEGMKGTIGVESEAGRGATFWFTAQFEKQPGGSSEKAVEPLPAARALIVDDNATARALLQKQLQAAGLEAETAADAESALALLQAKAATGTPYDMMLLDANPGSEEELALARRIKSEPKLAVTSIVLLSPIGMQLPSATLRENGIAANLTKPVRHEPLRDCLRAALRHEEAAIETIRPGRPATAKKSLRVLLAEDHPINRRLTLRQLELLGYAADSAGNGREAVEQLRRKPYDLVLMDCHMPEMDGFTATREIRRQGGTPGRVRVIALTADAMKGDQEKCLDAGMDDYLSKPISAEALKQKLEKTEELIEAEKKTG